jgi:hypothetical protein
VKGGIADPDGPEKKSSVSAAKDGSFTLPKASVTVLRGKLGATSRLETDKHN